MVRRAPIPTLTCHFLRLSYLLHACRWREAGGSRAVKGQLLLKGCTLPLQDDADGNFGPGRYFAVCTTASDRKLEIRCDSNDGQQEGFRNFCNDLEGAIRKANGMRTDAAAAAAAAGAGAAGEGAAAAAEYAAAAAAAKEELEDEAEKWDEDVFNERVLATVSSITKWNPPKEGSKSACRRTALRLGRRYLLRLLSAPDGDDVLGKVQCFCKLAKILLKKDGIAMATKKPSKTFGAAVGQFRAATEYVSVTLSVRLLPFFFSMNHARSKLEHNFHSFIFLACCFVRQRRVLVYIDRAAKKPRSLRFDVDDDDKDKFTDAAAYKGHFEKRLVELRKSMARNGRLKQAVDGRFPGSLLKLFASAFSIMLTAFNDGSEGRNLRQAGMNVRLEPAKIAQHPLIAS